MSRGDFSANRTAGGKSRTVRQQNSQTYVDGKYVPFVQTTVTDNTTSAVVEQSMRTAENTVDFRARVRKGIPLPFNDLNFKKEFLTLWYGGHTGRALTWPSLNSSVSYTTGAIDDPLPGVTRIYGFGKNGLTTAQMQDIASQTTNKVLLKIKDQKINLGQAIAERKQTMNLVADTAITIAKALHSVKSGNIVQAARDLGVGIPKRAVKRAARSRGRVSADEISRRWLQLQYGWKPLLSDVYGAMEQLAQVNPPLYLTATASTTVNVDLSSIFYSSTTARASTKGNTRFTSKKVIRYSVPYPAAKTLGQIGLTNPLMIAWELMPWSFVIDWFLPIGNWVNTFDATNGAVFHSGCTTTYSKTQCSARYQRFGQDASTAYGGEYNQIFTRVTCTRSKLISFPSAYFPSFKNPLGPIHIANALALLQLQRK